MTDREVQVLEIRRAGDESLMAVLFAYATHSTSLGPKNLMVSGDVHGLAEQFIEKHFDEGVIAPAFEHLLPLLALDVAAEQRRELALVLRLLRRPTQRVVHAEAHRPRRILAGEQLVQDRAEPDHRAGRTRAHPVLKRLLLFERRQQPLVSQGTFARRVATSTLVATTMILASLGIGVVGYRVSGGLGWLDSLYNASMILGGMGPVGELHTVAGKLFASFYALFSGVAFIATVGIVIAPLAHRLLHRLHVEDGTNRGDD